MMYQNLVLLLKTCEPKILENTIELFNSNCFDLDFKS